MCWQGWFLLRVTREGSVSDLSPWLIVTVFSLAAFSLCISVSKFTLFIRMPVIIGLGSTHMISFST